jgi:hypothetical protein
MAVGLRSENRKNVKKATSRKSATPASKLPAREAAPAQHVVGKFAELEPVENAQLPREEPEAAARCAEGLDAGYARYTESSDFMNRGRDRS